MVERPLDSHGVGVVVVPARDADIYGVLWFAVGNDGAASVPFERDCSDLVGREAGDFGVVCGSHGGAVSIVVVEQFEGLTPLRSADVLDLNRNVDDVVFGHRVVDALYIHNEVRFVGFVLPGEDGVVVWRLDGRPDTAKVEVGTHVACVGSRRTLHLVRRQSGHVRSPGVRSIVPDTHRETGRLGIPVPAQHLAVLLAKVTDKSALGAVAVHHACRVRIFDERRVESILSNESPRVVVTARDIPSRVRVTDIGPLQLPYRSARVDSSGAVDIPNGYRLYDSCLPVHVSNDTTGMTIDRTIYDIYIDRSPFYQTTVCVTGDTARIIPLDTSRDTDIRHYRSVDTTSDASCSAIGSNIHIEEGNVPYLCGASGNPEQS